MSSNGTFDDKWVKQQYRKKHSRLTKVTEELDSLDAKIDKVREKFTVKFQEKVADRVAKQKELQAEIDGIAKAFQDRLNKAVETDVTRTRELRASKEKLERQLLRLGGAAVAGDKQDLSDIDADEEIAAAPAAESEVVDDDGESDEDESLDPDMIGL